MFYDSDTKEVRITYEYSRDSAGFGLLIWLEENNYVKAARPWPRLFDLEYMVVRNGKITSQELHVLTDLSVLQNLPNLFPILGLAHVRVTG